MKHVSVRWLSLEKCMNRILKQFESLKSYFLSEEWADERFQRLHRWFSNHLLEPALMFETNAISMFTNFNLLLQRDEPSIHVLKAAMESLGRKRASRIVTPTYLCNSTSAFDLDLHDDQLYKQHTFIFLGVITRAIVNRLLNDGAISDNNYYKFYEAVHYYFKESLSYIQKKFPINDDLICNSVLIDFNKRSEVSWDNVEFFVDKYKSATSVNDITVISCMMSSLIIKHFPIIKSLIQSLMILKLLMVL